jgi:hypothetical protein
MTIEFVWDHASPEAPDGVPVKVVYDERRKRVVEANYLHNGYPMEPNERRLLGLSVRQAAADTFGSWKKFKTALIKVPV